MLYSSSVLSLATVAVLGIHACTTTNSPLSPAPDATAVTSVQLPITTILSAITSGFTEPAEIVIRDDPSLAEAWKTAHSGVQGNPAPTIDFKSRMVVLVSLGVRKTGGYSIRIDNITRDKDGAVVGYTVTSPGASCMTTQMITSPVVAVTVPQVNGTIRFERGDVVDKC